MERTKSQRRFKSDEPGIARPSDAWIISRPKLTVRGWLLYRDATTRSTCFSNSSWTSATWKPPGRSAVTEKCRGVNGGTVLVDFRGPLKHHNRRCAPLPRESSPKARLARVSGRAGNLEHSQKDGDQGHGKGLAAAPAYDEPKVAARRARRHTPARTGPIKLQGAIIHGQAKSSRQQCPPGLP
jgi:hypothetical protein